MDPLCDLELGIGCERNEADRRRLKLRLLRERLQRLEAEKRRTLEEIRRVEAGAGD